MMVMWSVKFMIVLLAMNFLLKRIATITATTRTFKNKEIADSFWKNEA